MKSCASQIFAALALFFAASGFSSREWMARRNDETDKERLEAAYARLDAAKGQPAEDISLPLERFDDGSVKTTLEAKLAWIFTDEPFVIAEGVHVRRLKEDGSMEMEIVTTRILADRKTKTIWIEGDSIIKTPFATATGSEIYFSFEDEMMRVYRGTRITTKALELKMENLLP